jgi:hypothetical protein
MVMSALPPKADMCGANRHVCFGPIADIALERSLNSADYGPAAATKHHNGG